MDTNVKLKAAYALNLWTVSISQIVDYNDIYVLEQEYNTIMNNLNLENMPKDETLLDVITEILDEITYSRMDDGDKELLERKYQHQLRTAVWSAVPNIGAIFATRDPIVMGVTLASLVGIGYMNYRRKKAEYDLEFEASKWQIQKNRMQHLHGLQKQLFETSWHLAEIYGFPDEYRLSANQISQYNEALMEPNPIKRYNKLDAMRGVFNAYPAFWYQIGSTANSIYRSDLYKREIQENYKSYALECFKKYEELNTFNLLRHDILTSAWALEYLELLDLNKENNPKETRKLIGIAEKYSGNAFDVLELCAFAYLRIQDEENATRLFHFLVNEDYNPILNAQILSALYIKRMRDDNAITATTASVKYAELAHITDPKHILEIPSERIDLSQWKPAWNQDDDCISFQKTKSLTGLIEKSFLEVSKDCALVFFRDFASPEKVSFYESASYIIYPDKEKIVYIHKENASKQVVHIDIPNVLDVFKKRRICTYQDVLVYLVDHSVFFYNLESGESGKITDLPLEYDKDGNVVPVQNIQFVNNKLIYGGNSLFVFDILSHESYEVKNHDGNKIDGTTKYFLIGNNLYFLSSYSEFDKKGNYLEGRVIDRYGLSNSFGNIASKPFDMQNISKMFSHATEVFHIGSYENRICMVFEYGDLSDLASGTGDRLGFECRYFDVTDEKELVCPFYIWNADIYQIGMYKNTLLYVNAAKDYSLIAHNYITDKKRTIAKKLGHSSKSKLSDRLFNGRSYYQHPKKYKLVGKWVCYLDDMCQQKIVSVE